ncbi:Scr1 family TA system antitoxin-like transcriptional regulator [Streptomyces sp. 8N114]|uniref:Scr1 family TA system antitoxin-like transcriptional regulator n=1 Tax=Streptomyces sp. 8N114 TaxID=3457419 RepID=UPI003FD16076
MRRATSSGRLPGRRVWIKSPSLPSSKVEGAGRTTWPNSLTSSWRRRERWRSPSSTCRSSTSTCYGRRSTSTGSRRPWPSIGSRTRPLPGLLQTEDYARAVFRSKEPPLEPDEVEVQVTGRMARQGILQRRIPPSTSFIISEAVLMDRLGGDGVRREQLRRLRQDPDLPGLAIQIMPLGREAHVRAFLVLVQTYRQTCAVRARLGAEAPYAPAVASPAKAGPEH